MDEQITQQIVDLQVTILSRITELGYANGASAEKISRHLAEIAVLSQAFSEHTLPLFVSMDAEHLPALTHLVVAMKCDLEEIQDALLDLDAEMRDLLLFLQERSASSL